MKTNKNILLIDRKIGLLLKGSRKTQMEYVIFLIDTNELH